MKTFSCLLLIMVVINLKAMGQERPKHIISPPIPMEAMVGRDAGMYQLIVSRNLDEKQRISFFNLSTYEDKYDEKAYDSYLTKTILGYNLSRKFNIGLGANFSSIAGFKPLVAATFTHFTRNWGLIIQPSYEPGKDGLAEVFSMLEWSPQNQKKFQPYGRIQLMSSFNNEHAFSYYYWRVGVQYKMLRIGPALNVQYAGADAISMKNVGMFINVLLR